MIDLRSDTVTRPSPGMRKAMFESVVGDVCFDDDPTVHRLEKMAAERTGHEAAIFVPTGSMANQIGIAIHLKPGDAALMDHKAHIAMWEAAAGAAYVGAQLTRIASDDGLPSTEDLQAALFPNHPKAPRNRLLTLENTHNGAGGIAHSPQAMSSRVAWARENNLAVHLDGARIFNACAAHDVTVDAFATQVDTMSFCLSKGLGAPVGSLLVGQKDAIEEANVIRHRLGGGWRQAGILAAAGIYALENHVERLADDHRRASLLAEALPGTGVVQLAHRVTTNIIYFNIDADWGTAKQFQEHLSGLGVEFFAIAPQTCRIVTHLDFNDDDLEQTLAVLKGLNLG